MIENLWFGTEHGYDELVAQLAMAAKLPSPDPKLFYQDDDDDEIYSRRNPIKHELVGGIAVATISGPLVTRSSWITQWLGIVSYDDIKSKLSELGSDTNVSAVVLNYDTPGGNASGCRACSRYIRDFSDKVRPVVSFSENLVASAGYWLFAAGEQRVIDEDSRTGSIGVIAVHTEYSEMYEQMGVKNTVFRSAPKKALGSPVEPLTDEARKEIEDEVAYIHQQFVTGVAEMIGQSEAHVSKKIATGEVFRAKDALRLKLADKQLSLETLVSRLAAQYRKKPASETTKRNK